MRIRARGFDDFAATDTLLHEVQLSWTQPSDPGAVHATVIRRADRYAETRDDVGEVTSEVLRFSGVESGELLEGSGAALDDTGRERVWELSEGWGAVANMACCVLHVR